MGKLALEGLLLSPVPLRVILVGSFGFCFCFFACVASFDFENCPALHPQPGKAVLLRRPLCPMG